MYQIKFGTDGWRAIIGKDFITDNVNRVSQAVATWLLSRKSDPVVVIGHDCRFAGKLFMEEAAAVLVARGVKVLYADGAVSTPMISLGTLECKADLGVVITASHNPPEYNGYKLKGSFGGPLLPEHIAEIEALIPDTPATDKADLNNHPEYIKTDLKTLYNQRVAHAFDMEAIRNSDFSFGYDAMFGAGQVTMNELFPEIELLHCTENPGFEGIAPEPILRNLQEFSDFIRVSEMVDCGLATDGDADRIGLFDSKGNFVDSHHIILLLIHYLVKYKQRRGKVVAAFSVTEKIKKLCAHYDLELIPTKIGFKYLTGHILNGDVLLAGEESGGIAIQTHIPERDGIWMGLTIWEFMAISGKSLEELVAEVYDIVGSFSYDRVDLHLTEAQKNGAMEKCFSGKITAFGSWNVQHTEEMDGFKFHFQHDAWLLVRASGTEPVLRIYAETPSAAQTQELLKWAQDTLIA